MTCPRLPDGWTENWMSKWPYSGVLAVCWYSHCLIEYWGVWWLAPFRWVLRRHERGHAWGVESCLSGSKFCVMAEDDDTWLGKAKLLPLQALGLGRYCSDCRVHLESMGAFDGSDQS